MAITDVESYLNQLVGRMVRVKQSGVDDLYLNVLSLNAIGLLVQDPDYEYFVPWATVSNLRLASEHEQARMGRPEFRQRIGNPVIEVE